MSQITRWFVETTIFYRRKHFWPPYTCNNLMKLTSAKPYYINQYWYLTCSITKTDLGKSLYFVMNLCSYVMMIIELAVIVIFHHLSPWCDLKIKLIASPIGSDRHPILTCITCEINTQMIYPVSLNQLLSFETVPLYNMIWFPIGKVSE